MAVKLNLLPPDYSLSAPVRQTIKMVKSLSVILLGLFIVMTSGIGAFLIISSISLKNLSAENESLKVQIQEQSTVQQQVVLLKDRLSQIKTVQAMPSAIDNLNKIIPVSNLVTGSSYISELSVDTQKTSASIVFRSNSDLTNFFKSISENEDYSSITLGTFNYSPIVGYQISLSFTNK